MARQAKSSGAASRVQRAGRDGRVVETRGRRVVVDASGELVVCFLAGHRAVLGDDVRFEDAPGEGGKLLEVLPRQTQLVRQGFDGKEQILAANLAGLLIVVAAQEPPLRPGLIDRYVVAAGVGGLGCALLVHKLDQGLPDDVRALLAEREARGLRVLYSSAVSGDGVDGVASFIAEQDGPWALVGHSGVGKTSLVAALLPGQDVGAIGDLSSHWGTGQHTTSRSKLFALPGGGVIADSPGIRTFMPGKLVAADVQRYFYDLGELGCRYRDCLHRVGEDGCVAEQAAPQELLGSYRRLLDEVLASKQRDERY